MTAEDEGKQKSGHLSAIDVSTGDIKWKYKTRYPLWGGCLATAGGLVFTGDPEGKFMAFDAKTGELLWDFQTGSGIHGPPITYAIDGVQYIAIPSGWAYEGTRDGDTLYIFALYDEKT